MPDPRPRLRGVLHAYGLAISIVLGGLLIAFASGTRARVATLIYVVCIAAMFGVSALYHRHWWRTARARAWMRRLDHSTIFLAIAGTYTPFALLVLDGVIAALVLAVVWGGGAAGVALNVLWPRAPRWVGATIYVALGWVGLVSLPQLFSRAGIVASTLVLVGGIAYSLGAVVYARRRPDPFPRVFGYHELFHALVAVAALVQFFAVADVVL